MPSAPETRWWRWPWAVAAAPVAIFAKGLAGLALYAPEDGNQLFIPWFLDSARSWLSGHLPTWNPWAQAGMPLLGSSQAGALYPPNLVFLALPVVVANNLTILISFLAAGLGAWLLARRLTGDGAAATVGGLGFGLCAFFFAHLGHQSLIAATAWLPWMLFGFEVVRERLTPGRLAIPAAAVALAGLAGHSQGLFDDLLLFGMYVVAGELLGGFGRLDGSGASNGSTRPLRNALLALAAVAAGLALSAVQLLPTAYVATRGIRQGLSYSQAMSYSLPVPQLPMLAFPYLFGKSVAGGPYAHLYGGIWNLTELSGYPGMAILVLAGAGAAALRRNRPARALAVTGTVALLLALGPATPLSRLLFAVPPFGGFRAWGRFIVGFDLALAMLAAYGTSRLRGTGPGRRTALIAAAGTAAAAVTAALVVPHLAAVARYLPHGHAAPAALLLPTAFAVAGAVGAALLARSRRVVPLLLAAVIVADSLLSFGAFCDWAETSPSPASFTAALSASHPIASGWGAVAREPGGIGRYFFIGATPIPIGQDFVDVTDARRQRSVNANNVLMARDWAIATDMGEDGSVTGTADLWQASSHVFDLLRVTTVLIDPVYAFGGPGPGSLLTGGTPVGHSGLLRYNYTPKLPEAFVVGASQQAGFSREMKAIHGDLAFDPAKVALIDQPCPACPAGPPGQAGSAGAVSWDASTAAVTVRAARPALLVLSQAWSPGWEATVRGRTVPVIRVDGLVQGVPVPAGTTRVVLTYHAPGLRAGFGITVAAVLAFLAAGAAGWWESRNGGNHELLPGCQVAGETTRSPQRSNRRLPAMLDRTPATIRPTDSWRMRWNDRELLLPAPLPASQLSLRAPLPPSCSPGGSSVPGAAAG